MLTDLHLQAWEVLAIAALMAAIAGKAIIAWERRARFRRMVRATLDRIAREGL